MSTKDKLWSFVINVAEGEGLELFDIDMPTGKSGVLRVYITKRAVSETRQDNEKSNPDPVGLADCANVNRRLSRDEELERIFPGDYTIEVSSPGITRRLRRPEHFSGAVGESIKLTYRDCQNDDSAKNVTVKGKVLSFDGENLVLESESSEELKILFNDIQKAKVNFVFD